MTFVRSGRCGNRLASKLAVVKVLAAVVLAAEVLAGWAGSGSSLASACTIPVFRYALERWESDRFLVVVYHKGPLEEKEAAAIKDLSQRSIKGGPLAIEVVCHDLSSEPPPPLLDVQPPPADRPLPWVEVRARAAGNRTVVRWEGPWAEAIAEDGLFDSPARREVVRRILSGHSAVWVLIAPEGQAGPLSEQLQGTLDEVTPSIPLPQGIGLPGSELYASIPLEIRHSVLPVSHSDPREREFLKWLAVFTPKWSPDAAYVVPVFGRCRALDVVPIAEVDVALVDEVANFVCSACSCRVKQANPGFDLLVTASWEQRLFGSSESPAQAEGGVPLSIAATVGSPSSEYVTIPAGSQPAGNQISDQQPSYQASPSLSADGALANAEEDGQVDANAWSQSVATALRSVRDPNKTLPVLVGLALVGSCLWYGAIIARRRPSGR